MWTLAKKCVAAYSSAVSTTAARAPDSRSMALCIAPRRNVSSMNATASALSALARTSLASAAAPTSAAAVQSSRPSAHMTATIAAMLATPSARPRAISRTNARRGKP